MKFSHWSEFSYSEPAKLLVTWNAYSKSLLQMLQHSPGYGKMFATLYYPYFFSRIRMACISCVKYLFPVLAVPSDLSKIPNYSFRENKLVEHNKTKLSKPG